MGLQFVKHGNHIVVIPEPMQIKYVLADSGSHQTMLWYW